MKPLSPAARPYLVLATTIVFLALIDGLSGNVLSHATAFSTLQYLATVGPVALGLGMTMLIREYDLSVAGVFSLASCIAVLLGQENPVIGLAAAVSVGGIVGCAQGVAISRLHLPSISVTLGGLLTTVGLAYVLTENKTLVYNNIDLALSMNERIAGLFTFRSLVACGLFVFIAIVIRWVCIGRDLVAIGSDPRAAYTAGVRVGPLIVLVFTGSGLLAAFSGGLLGYSLASASPSGLSDVLVPATAAAILGGVSLSGGTGTPLGIATGVLILGVLRAGLNALGAPPFAHDISMGAVLLLVAIVDAPGLGVQLQRVVAFIGGAQERNPRTLGADE